MRWLEKWFDPKKAVPRKYCGEFHGKWDERYWKNIPGPVYSTTVNMMSLLASNEDHDHLLYDDQCEFVWRQASSRTEMSRLLRAIGCDECMSYQIDGDSHWTPGLVRAWWRRKPELVKWAQEKLSYADDSRAYWNGDDKACDRRIFTEYVRYLQREAEDYLRNYMFFLLERREANEGETLPMI